MNWFRDNFRELFATIWSIAIIGLFYLIVVKGVKNLSDLERDIMMILVGYVGSYATQILQFFFGSSEGSKKKTEMMNGNTGSKIGN